MIALSIRSMRYTKRNVDPAAVNRFMTQNMSLSTETSQKVKELTQEELRIDDLKVNQDTELSHRYTGYKLLNIAFFRGIDGCGINH
ncbi:hypothetical protein MGH68_15160 [Erysipelothrix sp. D19-032]